MYANTKVSPEYATKQYIMQILLNRWRFHEMLLE